jgi:hypothetical protein
VGILVESFARTNLPSVGVSLPREKHSRFHPSFTLSGFYILFITLFLAVPLFSGLSTAAGQIKMPREQQLKAAFFYKFLGFIDWESRENSLVSPPQLCILGESSLDELVKELADLDREEVTIRSIQHPEDGRDCSLVFISRSEEEVLPFVLQTLKEGSAVTVSDIPGFVSEGGIIEFVMATPHVHFIINREAAERKGVRISSQLLALAKSQSRRAP